MKRVVLVNPPMVGGKGDITGTGVPYWPIVLAQLAAILKNDYDLVIVDLFGMEPRHTIIKGKIVRYGADISKINDYVVEGDLAVVFSGHAIGHSTVIDLIKEIKGAGVKKILVVEGSNFVNGYPLDKKHDDFVSVGAVPIAGDPYGVIVKAIEEDYRPTVRHLFMDIDMLPIPDWSEFPLISYWSLPYAHAPKTDGIYVQIYTSFGCNNRCLRGNTPINTVEGMIPIKDLVGREKIGVYTYNRITGEALISDAVNIRKTGTKELVRVKFDDDTHIDCTPDHKFICFKNGNQFVDLKEFEIEAKDLKYKQRVRAIRERYFGSNMNYIDVSWKRKEHKLRSRMIMEYFLGRELLAVEQVHHIDRNTANDRIKNLKLCSSAKEHIRGNHPEIGERMRSNNPVLNMTSEWKEKIRVGLIGLKRSNKSKDRYRLSKLGEKNPNYKGGLPKCIYCGKKVSGYNCKRCQKCRFEQSEDINHKVVSVKKLKGKFDVYNIEVPKYEVFYANNVLVHNCSFCTNPYMNFSCWRPRPISKVLEEMRHWYDEGVREFHIEDLNPTPTGIRAKELFKAIAVSGMNVTLKIASGTRIDNLGLDDIDIMYEAGIRYLSFSPESGSDVLLIKMNKKFSHWHALNIIRHIRSRYSDLVMQACFILGYPGETEENFGRTKRLVMKMAKMGVDEFAFFNFMPSLGSTFDNRIKISTDDMTFSSDWRLKNSALKALRFVMIVDVYLIKMIFNPLLTLRNFPKTKIWMVLKRRFL